jgi:hypothetical protein
VELVRKVIHNLYPSSFLFCGFMSLRGNAIYHDMLIIYQGAKSFGPMGLDHLVQALLLDLMLGGIG